MLNFLLIWKIIVLSLQLFQRFENFEKKMFWGSCPHKIFRIAMGAVPLLLRTNVLSERSSVMEIELGKKQED